MKLQRESALLTDLYELTMLQAYFERGMNQTAVFEFFVRHLPQQRNFLMAAGLPQVLAYLTQLRFDQHDLAWLRQNRMFSAAFVDSLESLRFTIAAPLREAQFVESRVMNLLHYQTLVASKAARTVLAAQGRRLVDFGLRRAHGAEAALLSARASYIAGFDGSATVLAAPLFGIPVFGTMAHSFVQAHQHEVDAFAAFARAFPDNATLLIDTYDTEAAARQVARLARWLEKQEGIRIKAVRIDSGDLGEVARSVRRILDADGGDEITIFASGNLDEYAVQALVQGGAPIDGFGVGTRMNTSSDAPFFDCAYKLVEYAGEPRRKRSSGKATWPGRKQVFRRCDEHGMLCGDTLALDGDQFGGTQMLNPVMRGGALLAPLPSLDQIRVNARSQLDSLPPELRALHPAPAYAVTISESLRDMAQRVDARQRALAENECGVWGSEGG